MRILTKKAKFVVATAAVGTLALSGVAYAYWTTTGTGSGSATVAAANGVLVLHSDTVTNVVPRATFYSVPILADNAGSTDLRVVSVHTVVSSSNAACQALITAGTSGLSVADTATDTNVAALASNVAIGTAHLVFANSATVNQDDCKSAPLTLTYNP